LAGQATGRRGDFPESFAGGIRANIAAETPMRELSVLPLVVGTVLGVIFGASSLYLV
jgi:hypothetical protein